MDFVQRYRRQRESSATPTLPELRRNIACQYSRCGAVSRGVGKPGVRRARRRAGHFPTLAPGRL